MADSDTFSFMCNRRVAATLFVAGLAVGACSGSDSPPESVPADPVEVAESAPANGAGDSTPPDETEDAEGTEDDQNVQMFPDVVDATAEMQGSEWTVSATLSSPYDTPERYADAWRVVDPGGNVLGERILTHDHASEQPFTRSQSGIAIPDDVDTVTIEGRDLEFGYGGDTFDLALSR